MNSVITSRILFLFFIFLCSSASANSDIIGSIKVIQGDVIIAKGDSQQKAKLHDKIYEGDIVETKDTGNIALLFVDGTQFSIGPNSHMIINRYLFSPKQKRYAFDVMLNSGSAIYTSGRLSKLAPEAVKIQTPQAVIGVRGTKFLVEVD
ncbi:FecR domain-containing protein [Psychromonas sp. KJ10-10]|uniref:FecR family protein n=1 Tax=Psychromonas sp. KJ10-10 TaxID=3391823 RepID=UPI0039B52AF3